LSEFGLVRDSRYTVVAKHSGSATGCGSRLDNHIKKDNFILVPQIGAPQSTQPLSQ